MNVEIVEKREKGPTAMTVEPAEEGSHLPRACDPEYRPVRSSEDLIGVARPITVLVNPSIRLP